MCPEKGLMGREIVRISTIRCYGRVLLERMLVSEGRGTTRPFEREVRAGREPALNPFND